MITVHPCFKAPNDPNVRVWRYLDLAKFMSMMYRSSLYFTRLDNLDDPFEGASTALNQRLAEQLIKAKVSNPAYESFRNIPDDQIRKLYGTSKDILQKMYINCWHMNGIENYAMWKIYTASAESICIQSTYEKLALALPTETFLGCVSYIDYENDFIDTGNVFNSVMHKRSSFSYEQELRAVIWQTDVIENNDQEKAKTPLGIQVGITLNELIENIFINPASPAWFKEIVVDFVHGSELNIPVKQSSLLGTPFFS